MVYNIPNMSYELHHDSTNYRVHMLKTTLHNILCRHPTCNLQAIVTHPYCPYIAPMHRATSRGQGVLTPNLFVG